MPSRTSTNRTTAVVVGLGMALLVVLVHQKVMGYDQEGCSAPRWTTLNEFGDGIKLRQRSGRCKLELDLRGDLRWNATEDGIEWIERSGKLDVEHRTEEARHRLKVRGDASGTPQVEYWRDGEETVLDADGRAWLHEIAMVMFRRLGIDAEERSRRIFEQQGVDGLVDEIEAISSDRVASLYARAAFDAPPAERTDALARTLRTVSRHVGSDHSVAELLVDLAESGLPPDSSDIDPSTDTFQRSLRDLLGSVGSDFDLRRSVIALMDAGAGPKLTEELFEAAAHGIGSDYDAAELVVAHAEDLEAGEPMSPGVPDLLHTIGSDYELRRTLVALLQTERTEADLRELLASAHSVGSDYDLAEILVAISRQSLTPALDEAYRATLPLIGSEYERKRAAEARGKKDAPS